MTIRNIIDRYAEKYYIEDNSIKLECFIFVKDNIDKCDLSKNVEGYVSTLVSSYFIRIISQNRVKKIQKIIE